MILLGRWLYVVLFFYRSSLVATDYDVPTSSTVNNILPLTLRGLSEYLLSAICLSV